VESQIVYVPKPKGDLREWLQKKWDEVSQDPFFVVEAPGLMGPRRIYRVLMGISHQGPDPREWSQRIDRLFEQAVGTQKDALPVLPMTEEHSSRAEPDELQPPLAERWTEHLHEAVVLNVWEYNASLLELNITCNEQRAVEYCRMFVERLVEIPGAKATSIGEREVKESAPRKQPRVPTRQRDFARWCACWRKIKPKWRLGKNYYEIREWLNAQDSDLEFSEDVLAEIIKAGEAGLLERN